MSRQAISTDVTEPSDRDLVAACLKGDNSAWEALIVRYQRLIYSIPRKARMSDDDAADIFQSVCLKLCQKLSTLRSEEKLSSWLIKITMRECWRVIAKQRSERALIKRDGDDDLNLDRDVRDSRPLTDEMQVAFEQQQLIREGLAALPERCQRLLGMLFYHKDEFSYADISSRMKMPASSIGPTRARCLENLKKQLEGKL